MACVEIRETADQTYVRDSKAPEVHILFPRSTWQRFVRGVQTAQHR